MNRPLVSLVMPAYNAEKYIGRAIESIISQTYDYWELLIVNDGSEDKTKYICEYYVNKDSRIKLFNQENQGVCRAKNFALQHVSGEYFIIVDSDDRLSNYALELYIKKAVLNNSDIIISGYIYNMNGQKQIRCIENEYSFYSNGILNSNEVSRLMKKSIISPNWNKLFHKKFLSYRFDTNYSINEDMIFSLTCIKNAKKITVLPNTLYEYIIQDNSLSRRFHFEFINSLEKMLEIIAENEEIDSIKIDIKKWFLNQWFIYIKNLCMFNDFSVEKKIIYLKEALNSTVFKHYGKIRYIDTRGRVIAFFLLKLKLYKLYMNLLNQKKGTGSN